MAFNKVTSYEQDMNFIESEVGLVLKTYNFDQTKATTDTATGKKLIKAGTCYPANDATAVGIVFVTQDMTDDAKRPGSLVVAGRVYEDRVTVSSTAKTALAGKGIVFVSAETPSFAEAE